MRGINLRKIGNFENFYLIEPAKSSLYMPPSTPASFSPEVTPLQHSQDQPPSTLLTIPVSEFPAHSTPYHDSPARHTNVGTNRFAELN